MTPPTSGIPDDAPCGFLSFLDDGTIAAINSTLLDMLGYTRAELVGRHIETIFVIGSRIFYQTHLFPLLQLHGAAHEIFLLLRTKEGGDLGVLANVERRDRKGGNVNDCIFVQVSERRKYEDALLRAKREADEARAEAEARQRDLVSANALLQLQHQQLEEQAIELEASTDELRSANTALMENGEQLARARKQADQANHAKSAFLANMSHELRTPLNAIGGYTQLLELGIHGALSTEQLAVLGRIQHGQRHLLGLINDVLNLSRIEAGYREYHLEDCSLYDVVHGVMPMIEPQLNKKALTYRIDVPMEVSIRADCDKLQQILLNLLSNAMKFTPSGGWIAVDVQQRTDVPDRLFLRVSDAGIGIPEDRLESVFQPFLQIGAETRMAEGTGLGLTISRDLARGMGGDLRVRSVEGQGSVFTITLPRSASA